MWHGASPMLPKLDNMIHSEWLVISATLSTGKNVDVNDDAAEKKERAQYYHQQYLSIAIPYVIVGI